MQRSDPRLTIETLMASSKGVLEAATRWQEELLKFVGKRMNGYVELARDLQECRSPTDVLNLQTSFVRQMLSDYRAEAEWITRQFLQAEKPAKRQIDRAFGSYEETILKAQRDAARIIELAKDQAARILENAEARPQRKTGRGKKSAQG
jgi:Phasin protein